MKTTVFKYFIETVKPISKEEAIQLFIFNWSNSLDKAGLLKNEETINNLKKQLGKEYNFLLKKKPFLFDRYNQKEIDFTDFKIKQCEFERVFITMNGKYVYVDRDYILNNLKENKLTKSWDIVFDNELTSIKQAP